MKLLYIISIINIFLAAGLGLLMPYPLVFFTGVPITLSGLLILSFLLQERSLNKGVETGDIYFYDKELVTALADIRPVNEFIKTITSVPKNETH